MCEIEKELNFSDGKLMCDCECLVENDNEVIDWEEYQDSLVLDEDDYEG